MSEKLAGHFTLGERAAIEKHAECEQRSVAWIIRRATLADLEKGKR